MQTEKVKLNESQSAAYDVLENGTENVFLTGDAGSGKSFLVNYWLENSKKKIVALAPTGRAALNIKGETIHSFFKLPISIFTPKLYRPQGQKVTYSFRWPEIILIDEASMIRADILDGINYVLKKYGRDSSKPFGGARIILVGDLAQLPPVVSRDEEKAFYKLYSTSWFFGAKVFSDEFFKSYSLTIPMRQSDPVFISVLNDLRYGKLSDKSRIILSDRIVDPAKDVSGVDRDYVTLCATNASAKKLNEWEILKMENAGRKLHSFRATISGDINVNDIQAEENLTICEGARVMFLRNSQEGYRNGTIGTVLSITDNKIAVKADSGKKDIVDRAVWERFKYRFTDGELSKELIGSFTQYPLRLAYAVTIHKSQGMTFSDVHVDFGRGAFAHGQAYVALSRCTSLNGLTLQRTIREDEVIFDQDVTDFLSRGYRNEPKGPEQAALFAN